VGRKLVASKPSTAPRIVIADDHHLFRSAFVDLLNNYSDFEVVGEAEDGRGALELCRHLRPDLVLMDVGMPGTDGLEATRAIKRELPRTTVLMITASQEPRHMAEALRAGAAGFVLKTAPPPQVFDAVRRALEGESPLNQEVARQVILSLTDEKQEEAGSPVSEVPTRRRSDPASGGALTPREVEILRLVARGYSNQQIASELHISTSTTKNHLQRVLAKLGAADRTQAVAMAMAMGALPNL
jgi:DNA-binding NarL/FixJ family response regulator